MITLIQFYNEKEQAMHHKIQIVQFKEKMSAKNLMLEIYFRKG